LAAAVKQKEKIIDFQGLTEKGKETQGLQRGEEKRNRETPFTVN